VTISRVKAVVGKNDRVYLAVFTDGMENASKEYSGDQIRVELEKVRSKGWEVNFFCGYGEVEHYKRELNLDDNVACCMPLNEEGFESMKLSMDKSLKKIIQGK